MFAYSCYPCNNNLQIYVLVTYLLSTCYSYSNNFACMRKIFRSVYCSSFWRLYTRRTIVRRELERTRANSGELRANSPAVRRHPHSGELRRTFAGVRRTFAGVRRSSLGFARVRAYSAANWRTVRQKIRSPEEISTSVRRERGPPRTWFAANEVRRELRSRRTTTLANSFAKNF